MRRRTFAALTVTTLVGSRVGTASASAGEEPAKPGPAPARQLPVAGLIANQSSLRSVYPVSRYEARGAAFIAGSNVLRLATGELYHVPLNSPWAAYGSGNDAAAMDVVSADRAWLATGTVPGGTRARRRLAERALLEMRALTRPNGASAAAWYTYWNFSWPRDASWVSVAFSATGHHSEARAVLGFTAGSQNDNGTWEARHHLIDGAPVADGRHWQLDANGWVPWAVWFWQQTHPDRDAAQQGLAELWPTVRKAADYAAGCLGADGLPPAAPDYWESRIDQVTIGTAAPLRTGLRSAATLAGAMGEADAAERYALAAARLDRGIRRTFAPRGYPRSTDPGSGADSAVTFLAPPFAPREEGVAGAVAAAAAKLTLPNGGILPGEDWIGDRTQAWTPETGFFALAAAASGNANTAARWLRWIGAHRTELGAIPEKVDREGRPASVAPLGWSDAITLLALTALDRPLPVP